MNELRDWENSLDQALHTYANPLPRPGLEARMLASAPQPARAGWGWPLAAGVAACLAIAAVYLAIPRKIGSPKIAANVSLPVLAPRETSPVAPAPMAQNLATHPVPAHLASRERPPAPSTVFPSTFPTPAPLTPEEQRMQQLARNPHMRSLLSSPPEIEVSILEITPTLNPQLNDRSQP